MLPLRIILHKVQILGNIVNYVICDNYVAVIEGICYTPSLPLVRREISKIEKNESFESDEGMKTIVREILRKNQSIKK